MSIYASIKAFETSRLVVVKSHFKAYRGDVTWYHTKDLLHFRIIKT